MSDWVRVRYLGGGPDPDPSTEPKPGRTIDFARGPMNGEWYTGTGKSSTVYRKKDGFPLVSVTLPVVMMRTYTATELEFMGLDADGDDQIAWRYTDDSRASSPDDDDDEGDDE
jgi:hypothetical protein